MRQSLVIAPLNRFDYKNSTEDGGIMASKTVGSSILFFGLFLLSIKAHAFNPLRLHCLRHEKHGEQTFLSEINFRISKNLNSLLEGELVSYSLQGREKRYVSGYNLFSIHYTASVISGLTGDPITRTDGVFSLTKMESKRKGIWKFVYSGKDGTKIDAEFNCTYHWIGPYALSPSDMPSR